MSQEALKKLAMRFAGGEIDASQYEAMRQVLLDTLVTAPPEATQATVSGGGTSNDHVVLPALGDVVNDRYQLLEKIGQGGMGLVYKAKDTEESTEEEPHYIALKFLDPRLQNNPLELERFKREASNSRRLRHQNIVACYYFGEHQLWHYIAMEWLAGQSLAQKQLQQLQHNNDSAAIPWATVKQWLPDIAAALHHAHNYQHEAIKGIIHRDIKPANIFIEPNGRAVVLDFGIARTLRDTMTKLGALAADTSGSIDYLPPEALVAGHKPQPQDDIYSLAVTLYELLTGELPFNSAVVYSRTASTPMPPKPDDLNEPQWCVLAQGLAFSPEDRWPSCWQPEDKRKHALQAWSHALLDAETYSESQVQAAATAETNPSVDQDTPDELTVCVPDIGVDEADVYEVSVNIGDYVGVDDTVCVLETDKASIEVPSPHSGIVSKVVAAGDKVRAGDMLCTLLLNGNPPAAVVDKDTALFSQIVDGKSLSDLMALRRQQSYTLNTAEKIRSNTTTKGGITPSMVLIPGGRFTMGSPDSEPERLRAEGPLHQVHIKPFYCGVYTVTFDEWNVYKKAMGDNRIIDGKKHPIINVTWHDVQRYIEWLNTQVDKPFRLLSEAEWEYACRAGTTTAYHTGHMIKSEWACFQRTGLKALFSQEGCVDVGRFNANAFGLHDMHGNVWEWVQDCWHDNYNHAPSDGSVWLEPDPYPVSDPRVLRGGSALCSPDFLRSATRVRNDARKKDVDIGFRLAQDV